MPARRGDCCYCPATAKNISLVFSCFCCWLFVGCSIGFGFTLAQYVKAAEVWNVASCNITGRGRTVDFSPTCEAFQGKPLSCLRWGPSQQILASVAVQYCTGGQCVNTQADGCGTLSRIDLDTAASYSQLLTQGSAPCWVNPKSSTLNTNVNEKQVFTCSFSGCDKELTTWMISDATYPVRLRESCTEQITQGVAGVVSTAVFAAIGLCCCFVGIGCLCNSSD